MGRAIVREPRVFLFDEPLSNLDAKLRVQMRLEIKKLQERLKTTSVYVTHDQVEAMTLGHRLMVLNGGYVEQFGTPIELYERPATTFVAGFIGSPAMNFLEGRTDAEGKSAELAIGGRVALPQLPADSADRPVTIGMRPEHLRIDGAAEAMTTLTMEVVEQLGADTLVHGVSESGGPDITVRLDGIRSFSPREKLPLTIDAANLHLFDANTGRRIG